MTDETASNLSWLSRVMAWLSTIGMVLWPVGLVAAYVFPGDANTMNADHLGAALNAGVPLIYRLGALVCSLAGEGFIVWALWSLRRLFLLYAGGEVFSPKALRLLNDVAAALFASVIVGFVMHGPITFLLSLAVPDHHLIGFDLGSDDVVTLFCAGVVLVVARVMREARRLADENAKFV
ncbi:MAG TPA: DUF2975 domain-containing protein [Rhizomicrobium sp.]